MTERPPTGRSSTPRLLLIGMLPGFGAMHLPRHLHRVGFDLAFAGTQDCMTSRSGHIGRRMEWRGDFQHSFEPFLHSFEKFQPTRVVPLDELANLRLQQIGAGLAKHQNQALPAQAIDLVQRSLGDPRGYSRDATRRVYHAIAQQASIAVPAQRTVSGIAAILEFAQAHGYPVVLKRELSMGGVGVFILESEAQAARLGTQQKVGLGPVTWVVQSHATGQLGMHAVFADEGRVLAQVSAVQQSRRDSHPTSPSSVVTLCQHQAMADAAARFVQISKASGFHGWDFQLDASGGAVMIEHNPRAISITHLGGLVGSDLCGALASSCGLASAPNRSCLALPSSTREVALFPDEWRRDPRSPKLGDTYHDAPWDDPELLVATLTYRGGFKAGAPALDKPASA